MNYTVGLKEYPIIESLEGPSGEHVPVVDVPLMSDIKWQRMALEERLRHPELYALLGEDVPATVQQLRAWLRENDPEWKE